MGSVGSFQCQIVPCPGLYLFSNSIVAPQMHSLSLTAGFESIAPVTYGMVPPSLLILSLSVWKSLQCLIFALTPGGEGGYLFRLTCSVVL